MYVSKYISKKTLVLMLVLIPLLGACGGGSSNDTSPNEVVRETFTIAISGDAVSMDLHGTNDNISNQVNRQLFETLVVQNENMELQPGLASDWRPIDDRVWEFDLLEGVSFHNGEILTAYDVAFTMERASRSPQVEPFLGVIDPDTIEVVDSYTIRIGTYEPFSPFLRHLAHPSAGIMNELAVEEAGDDVDRNPVGTGPFKFASWAAGDRIVLERFDDYHGDVSDLSEIVFRIMSDGQARTMAIETGDVDVTLSPLPIDLDRLENHNDIEVLNASGLRVEYLGLNYSHEYLNNVLVRHAINYVLNTEIIVDAAFEGRSNLAQTHVAPAVFGYNPDIAGFPYDVERARELMAQAGLEDGFSITLTVNSEHQQRIDMATMIANQLREINIHAEIEQIEWATFLGEVDSGNLDMFILGWGAITGDADYALFPTFHSTSINGGGNSTLFSNPQIDAMLDEARSTTDEASRLQAYSEILEVLREETPWVLLNQDNVFVATRANVHGFTVHPANVHFFGNVYLAE